MADKNQSVKQNALIGLVASVVLALVKLGAGIIGHSSALIADATESLADAIGSILVWQALRVSSKPSDTKHPYGYGKAEALASLFVGLLLLAAAFYIVIKSCREMLVPHDPPEVWTLAVLVIVIVVKEWLFRKLIHGAEEASSDAAAADAWHHRSDAITSAAAFIGVTLAVVGTHWFQIGFLALADEAAAILASGIIVFTAVQLIRPSLSELLDASSHEMEKRIYDAAHVKEGVRKVEKVHVRKSGSGYHVDMHLHVSPDLSVRLAHSLAGKVKAELMHEFRSLHGVLIHIEPDETDSQGPSADANAVELR